MLFVLYLGDKKLFVRLVNAIVMNDEISTVFLRLEEIAELIRGAVGGTAGSGELSFQGAKATQQRDCDRLNDQRHGTFQSSQKAEVASHAESQDLEMVEAMISIRSLRDRYFEGDLFFDPAWSMLIDLYRADLKRQMLSITSVCVGSGVPESTALRYVRALEDRGYARRAPDPQDKRRVFLHLTAKAREKLDAYFERVNAQCRAA
jgi:hypothetical protein